MDAKCKNDVYCRFRCLLEPHVAKINPESPQYGMPHNQIMVLARKTTEFNLNLDNYCCAQLKGPCYATNVP